MIYGIKNISLTILFCLVCAFFIGTHPANCQPAGIIKPKAATEQAIQPGQLRLSLENTESQYLKPADQSTKSSEPSILNILGSLMVVVLLIIISAILYAKFNKINPERLLSGKFNSLDKNKISILSSATLGNGQSIHLVKINNKKLVVGSCVNSVRLITELNDEEQVFDSKNS